jgi:hypothetical protein
MRAAAVAAGVAATRNTVRYVQQKAAQLSTGWPAHKVEGHCGAATNWR